MWERCADLSLKLMACEDVARARWRGVFVADESVLSKRGIPGRGWVVGKLRRWRTFCFERNSLRGMGSWAQAWKISAAWVGGKKGDGQFVFDYKRVGKG